MVREFRRYVKPFVVMDGQTDRQPDRHGRRTMSITGQTALRC